MDLFALAMLTALLGGQDVPPPQPDPVPVVVVAQNPDCLELQAGFAAVERALDKLEQLEGPVDPEGD